MDARKPITDMGKSMKKGIGKFSTLDFVSRRLSVGSDTNSVQELSTRHGTHDGYPGGMNPPQQTSSICI